MSTVVKPHRLLILACSNVKRVSVRPMPARDRYDGPLWQTLRRVDPLEQKARVAFFSARCGFRVATSPVEQYDCLLTEEIAGRMKAGGLGTRWPRPDIHRGIILPREHAGKHIHAMTRGGAKPFDDVCLVGGALYVDVMRHFVALFRERGYVTRNAVVTEICAPIGIMRQRMAAWLNKPAGGGS